MIENGVFMVGVVFLSVLKIMYWSDGETGAMRRREEEAPQSISCREANGPLTVVASRSHRDSKTDDYLASFDVGELISAGSSLKLCRVAEGSADMYPRLGRTMEWDIAAGHAVLFGAGGTVKMFEDVDSCYGKEGLDNFYFVVCGK